MANVERLKRVINSILSGDVEHDQDVWISVASVPSSAEYYAELDESPNVVPISCGTACCVAGAACLDAGDRPMLPQYVDSGINLYDAVHRGGSYDLCRVVDAEGRKHYVEDRAKELLGLTQREADALFTAGNSRDDLRAIASMIIDGQFDPADEARHLALVEQFGLTPL